MPEKINIRRLHAWQRSSWIHPYTCGSGQRTDEQHFDGEGILVATESGWICPFCDYSQEYRVLEAKLSAEDPLDHPLRTSFQPSEDHATFYRRHIALEKLAQEIYSSRDDNYPINDSDKSQLKQVQFNQKIRKLGIFTGSQAYQEYLTREKPNDKNLQHLERPEPEREAAVRADDKPDGNNDVRTQI